MKIFSSISTVSVGAISKMIVHYSTVQVLATLAYTSKGEFEEN